MKRPRIAVSTRRSRRGEWHLLRYLLRRSGARVRRVTGANAADLAECDGLVLGGGEDIHPAVYGEGSRRGSGSERDELELALLASAEEHGLPVLGICRGAQLLNVFRGGTLFEDISDRRPPGWRRRVLRPILRVAVASPSRLAQVLGCDRLSVNSLHHQSIRRVGSDLRAVAHDEFGLVQGVEGSGERFVLGVQWHPELLPAHRTQRRIFRALVQAAGAPGARARAGEQDLSHCGDRAAPLRRPVAIDPPTKATS